MLKIFQRFQALPVFGGDMSIAAPSDRLLDVMNPAYMVAAALSALGPGRCRTEPEEPMQYLCLIYDDETSWQKLSQAEAGKIMGEFHAYTESIKKSGHYVGGNALQPTHTATTVRVRQGKVATTDGPFAETKEQLGGYYLVEARDLNEAIQVASRIPGARLGCIEVRPILEFSK
jgi:hypothetical protein